MEKFGATRTPTSGASASQPSRVASRSASKPVVPTTAWTPCPTQNSRLSITASGWVKSTTASRAGLDQRLQRVVDVEGRHQLEVVGRVDRAAHLGADLALCTEHADPSYRRHVARTYREGG